MDVNDPKMLDLYGYVEGTSDVINKLCNIRKDDENRVKFQNRLRKIKDIIESDQMLLFIGTFSSGKSTLANALLGVKDLLPTASRPCTSFISVIGFKRDGLDHKARIVKIDKEEGEYKDYDEIKLIIDNHYKGKAIAEIHYVDVLLDVEQLPDWEENPLYSLERLNVKIVDCPGYDSPIGNFDETIIDEFIEKANYTFWVNEGERYGGIDDIRRLNYISQKTTALIPIVSKSDLITKERREQIKKDFYKCFEPYFNNKELRFISAHKWNEAVELRKKLKTDTAKDMPKEEKDKIIEEIKNLMHESGTEQISRDMINSTSKKEIADEKIKFALQDLLSLINDICSLAEKEEKNWLKKAQDNGYEESDQYRELDALRRDVRIWIKDESKRVGRDIKTEIIAKITDTVMSNNGKIDTQILHDQAKDIVEEKLNKEKEKWAENIYNRYKKYAEKYPVDTEKNIVKRLELNGLMSSFNDIIIGFLNSIKFAGFQTIIMGGLGGVTLALASSMPASIGIGPAFIGATMSLAPVIAVATGVGIALILCAALPLIGPISDQIKNRRIKREEEVKNKLDEYLREIKFSPAIAVMLNEANEKMYESYRENYGNSIDPFLKMKDRSEAVKDSIFEIRDKLTNRFIGY